MVINLTPTELKEQGLHQFKSGRYDEALTSFNAAAPLFAAQEDYLGQGEMLNNIGVIHRFQRRYDAAATALHQAHTLFAQARDINRQAQTIANLGELHRSQGAYESAGRCYSDASELFAQVDDKDKQAEVLWALSLLRTRQRHWLEAVYIMHDSLKLRPRRSFIQTLLYAFLRLGMWLMGGKP